MFLKKKGLKRQMIWKKKTLVAKEKKTYFLMLKNISFQSANQQEILAYSYVSEHSKNFLILKDKIAFLAAGGSTPP